MAKQIAKKSEDFARWYTDVVQRAEMADYSPVKGCMVIRPYGYAIWENMQADLDRRIKKSGHENAYFPLFIPEEFIKREADHVEGFAPELAVVTHAGGKKLESPLIVRPTSETIINEMFSKWIESYRDLPLLINQWANVVRWELRTRLFLRTTEFLWQEGHTAHATHDEAEEETLSILEMYRSFMEDFLAIPVLTGRKSETEKFAGALHTYALEALMTDGRALQMGTTHNLGQNFAKVFDITFLDSDGERKLVWQTSWGVSTRMVGALVMAHGDENGLILPPRVAPIPVVIVPIYRTDEERARVLETSSRTARVLEEAGIVTKVDDRDTVKPGFKFNEWELKGVPLRIEIGPRDVASNSCVTVRRHDGQKTSTPLDSIADTARRSLDEIHEGIYERALAFRADNTRTASSYDEFREILERDAGFVWAHWCEDAEVEAKIKEDTKATIRVIPEDGEPGECIVTGRPSPRRVLFAKAY